MTERAIRYVPLDEVVEHPDNPKGHDEDILDESLRMHGFIEPGQIDERTGRLIGGHGRLHALQAMQAAGHPAPDGVQVLDDGRWAMPLVGGWASRDDEHALRALIVLNRATEAGGWHREPLLAILGALPTLEGTGFRSLDELPPMPSLDGLPDGNGHRVGGAGSLADRFLIPPFSVLDARQGWWQDRKRAWIALGIRSEIGRGEAVTWGDSEQITEEGLNFYRKREAEIRANRHKPAMDYSEGERGLGSGAPIPGTRKRAAGPHPGGGGGGAWIGTEGAADVKWARAYKGQESLDDLRGQSKRLTFATGVERTDDTSARIVGGGRKVFAAESIRVPDTDSVAGEAIRSVGSGTSIFDPVLCELVYRWFCPPGGVVLDPFAGGSVRGIVAGRLGREYVGMDLSAEQVEANRLQGAQVCGESGADNRPDVTAIERVGDVWLKRDDYYRIAGSAGGKVRSCWALMSRAAAAGATGFVTAGSRHSPQVNIVAGIAARLGLPCRVHVPSGESTAELVMAAEQGADVVRHKPGYNTVIVARARDDAAESGWFEIPFGMECPDAVAETATQAVGLPDGVGRVVVSVGSGMTLAGILTGLVASGRQVPVLGVVVGADPTERLDKWAPDGWRDMVTLVPASVPYAAHVAASIGRIVLDPVYEAKCAEHLQPDDLLWIIGRRATAGGTATEPRWVVGDSRTSLPAVQADMVFSCPPYADLEEYSDDPADLSTFTYPDFRQAHAEIIAAAVDRLRPDRYAVWVIGEARGPDGNYYGLVPDTVAAFVAAGCHLYNEAVLVTAVGSLPVRAGRQFAAGRKLGKTHQNVLVFVKGDGRAAADACGPVEVVVGDPNEGPLDL